MLQLAVQTDPLADEGMLGFIGHLAFLNSVSVEELIKILKCSDSHDVNHWLDRIGKRAAWGGSIAELRNPSTRPIRLWNHQSFRYCPSCLAEQSRWKLDWELRLVTCCPKHRNALIDRCSLCDEPVSHETLRENRCQGCFSSLAECIAPQKVDDVGEFWIADQFKLRLTKEVLRSRHVTAKLSIQDFNELVWRIGVRGSPITSAKPLKLIEAHSLACAIPIADVAGQALRAWPNSYYKFIDQIRRDRSDGQDWKLSSSIGPFYRDIYSRLAAPDFGFLRVAFADYLESHWAGPITLRNRNLGAEKFNTHRWKSIAQASDLIGLEPALIGRMAGNGELNSITKKYRGGRETRLVDTGNVEQRLECLASTRTLSETAMRMKISKERVRQLLENGILRYFGGKPRPGEKWWIDPDSIPTATVDSKPISATAMVTLAQLAQHRLPSADQFCRLIRSIQEGNLQVIAREGEEGCLGSWRLNQNAFEGWLANTLSSSKLLSIVEAATELGVKQEVAYSLVEIGLLPAQSKQVLGRKKRQVTFRDLQEFKKKFVLSRELLDAFKTNPKNLPKIVAMRGFQPVAGPTVRGCYCRQYVWRRSARLLQGAQA